MIGLCYNNGERTGCLNPEQFTHKPWRCPAHNRPAQLKVCSLHKCGDAYLTICICKYDISNLGRAGFLHNGRCLVPLFHLVLITAEVGLQLSDVAPDFVTPHLMDIYSNYSKKLVSYA